MNRIKLWNTSSHRSLFRRLGYALLGTVLTFFYARLVHAQTANGSSVVQNPYTIETILAAIASAIITVFFLRGMYLVLTYASETYGFDDGEEYPNSEENNALLYGALGWIIGSAIVIASYGWDWRFLYIGPIVCLLGPIVPIVAMKVDIQKYREILAQRPNNYRGDY